MSRNKIHKSDLYLNEIGGRIAFIRLDHKQTHREFAKIVGISIGNLSEVENHKHNPSYIPIARIIELYNVNPMWLLFGKGETYINKDSLCENNIFEKTLSMAKVILESKTDYATSLAANIKSLHKSIELEKRISTLEHKCDELIEEVNNLKKGL